MIQPYKLRTCGGRMSDEAIENICMTVIICMGLIVLWLITKDC